MTNPKNCSVVATQVKILNQTFFPENTNLQLYFIINTNYTIYNIHLWFLRSQIFIVKLEWFYTKIVHRNVNVIVKV